MCEYMLHALYEGSKEKQDGKRKEGKMLELTFARSS